VLVRIVDERDVDPIQAESFETRFERSMNGVVREVEVGAVPP
jgi:hypothetical protein